MAVKSHFASLLFIFTTCYMAASCRTMDVGHDQSDVESASQPWFDSTGTPAECAPVAKSCPVTKDPKEFVDKCVAAKFQAKTCGCEIRCSGKVPMPASYAATEVAQKEDPLVCPSATIQALDESLVSIKQSFDSYKCVTSHVCGGQTVPCSDANKQISVKIRQFANQKCRSDVLLRFCPDQFVESLGCSEADIETLSQGWKQAFKGTNPAAKACFQGVICNDSSAKCNTPLAGQAKSLKSSVDKDGCGYWLKNFCSLGNSSL